MPLPPRQRQTTTDQIISDLPEESRGEISGNSDFLFSDDRVTEENIDDLYRSLLGRDADPSGRSTYLGKSLSRASSAIMGSGEFELRHHGEIRPLVRKKDLEKGMTFDQFSSEWNQVNRRPPTQSEYENWVVHGRPKQLLIEGSGLSRDLIIDEKGTKVRVYSDLSLLEGDKFNFAHEGELVAVPSDTLMADGYDLIDEAEGMSVYYKTPQHGGLLGAAADITGINEFEDLRDKWIPKEFWGLSFHGGEILAGTRTLEGQEAVADDLGIKTEELRIAGDIALYVAGADRDWETPKIL